MKPRLMITILDMKINKGTSKNKLDVPMEVDASPKAPTKDPSQQTPTGCKEGNLVGPGLVLLKTCPPIHGKLKLFQVKLPKKLGSNSYSKCHPCNMQFTKKLGLTRHGQTHEHKINSLAREARKIPARNLADIIIVAAQFQKRRVNPANQETIPEERSYSAFLSAIARLICDAATYKVSRFRPKSLLMNPFKANTSKHSGRTKNLTFRNRATSKLPSGKI